MPSGLKIPKGDKKEEILQMKRKLDRIQLSFDAKFGWNSRFQWRGGPNLHLLHFRHPIFRFLKIGCRARGTVFFMGDLIFPSNGIVLDSVLEP